MRALRYYPLNPVHEPAVVAIEAAAKTLKLRILNLLDKLPTRLQGEGRRLLTAIIGLDRLGPWWSRWCRSLTAIASTS